MNLIPMTRYRMTQTSDGAGGFTPTPGTAYPFYGGMSLFDINSGVLIDRDEDVSIEDWIVVQDEIDGVNAYFRVIDMAQQPNARNRMSTVERMDRPIWPNP